MARTPNVFSDSQAEGKKGFGGGWESREEKHKQLD